MTTYTVTVTKTATKTTYTVTLPNGDCGHAVLVLPVAPQECADEPPPKTWDQL